MTIINDNTVLYSESPIDFVTRDGIYRMRENVPVRIYEVVDNALCYREITKDFVGEHKAIIDIDNKIINEDSLLSCDRRWSVTKVDYDYRLDNFTDALRRYLAPYLAKAEWWKEFIITGKIPGYNLETTTMLINLAKCLVNGTMDQVEKLAKAVTPSFFLQQICDENFSVSAEGSKLAAVVDVPKSVLDFANENPQFGKLSDWQEICKNDNNEGVFLMEYLKTINNLKVTKRNVHEDWDVKGLLPDLCKIKKHMDIKVHKLLGYLIKQEVYYGLTYQYNGLTKPADLMTSVSSRTYVDYLAMVNWNPDLAFPSILTKAHNICVRNKDLLHDKEFCKKFEETVKDFAKYEYSGKKYTVLAPKTVKDLVEEGDALSHCVATYATPITNGESIVLFIRKNKELDKSLATVEIDKDYNVLQLKGDWNEDVGDPEILSFIKEWKEEKENVKIV